MYTQEGRSEDMQGDEASTSSGERPGTPAFSQPAGGTMPADTVILDS